MVIPKKVFHAADKLLVEDIMEVVMKSFSLDLSPKVSYHKQRYGPARRKTMERPEAGDDKTRIRMPSQAVEKIPARLQASVVIVEGYAQGMEYPLTKTYSVIGRDTDVEVALKDPLVSRRHVAIVYHEGEFILKDLESTNGTQMKGALIQQAALRHRDKFHIGDTILQFILVDSGSGRTYEISG